MWQGTEWGRRKKGLATGVGVGATDDGLLERLEDWGSWWYRLPQAPLNPATCGPTQRRERTTSPPGDCSAAGLPSPLAVPALLGAKRSFRYHLI